MKFSGVKSKRTISKFGKTKFLSCVHLLHKSGKCNHVAVVQGQLRNEQKCVLHLQSCCFSYCFFAILVAIAVVLALTPCSCDPEILQLW